MPQVKRDLLEKVTYGYYIVTTRAESDELSSREKDYVAAGVVSWMMQSSFEPPMVTIAIFKDNDLNETIHKAGTFAVNILGKDDQPMIDAFAKDSTIKEQKINGYSFLNAPKTHAPVFESGLGYLECKVVETVKTEGDHVLFVGEIINHKQHEPEAMPLHEWETGKHYGGFA